MQCIVVQWHVSVLLTGAVLGVIWHGILDSVRGKGPESSAPLYLFSLVQSSPVCSCIVWSPLA